MTPAESTLVQWARRSVWLLPVWAAFLAASTVTHQPDAATDFGAYADFVTTKPFLISHLALSIVGAGLAVVGAAALAILVAGGDKGRTGLRGFAAFSLGNVLATAVFGVAAFFQPAIGRAFQGGVTAATDINEDVYGPTVVLTVVVGMVAMILGIGWLARALRSAAPDLPRWVTATMTWSLPPFVLTGIVGVPVQPLFAAALAIALGVMARSLAVDHALDASGPAALRQVTGQGST